MHFSSLLTSTSLLSILLTFTCTCLLLQFYCTFHTYFNSPYTHFYAICSSLFLVYLPLLHTSLDYSPTLTYCSSILTFRYPLLQSTNQKYKNIYALIVFLYVPHIHQLTLAVPICYPSKSSLIFLFCYYCRFYTCINSLQSLLSVLHHNHHSLHLTVIHSLSSNNIHFVIVPSTLSVHF